LFFAVDVDQFGDLFGNEDSLGVAEPMDVEETEPVVNRREDVLRDKLDLVMLQGEGEQVFQFVDGSSDGHMCLFDSLVKAGDISDKDVALQPSSLIALMKEKANGRKDQLRYIFAGHLGVDLDDPSTVVQVDEVLETTMAKMEDPSLYEDAMAGIPEMLTFSHTGRISIQVYQDYRPGQRKDDNKNPMEDDFGLMEVFNTRKYLDDIYADNEFLLVLPTIGPQDASICTTTSVRNQSARIFRNPTTTVV
jgi:hypothetical protein